MTDSQKVESATCRTCHGAGDMCPHCDGYGQCWSRCCAPSPSAEEEATAADPVPETPEKIALTRRQRQTLRDALVSAWQDDYSLDSVLDHLAGAVEALLTEQYNEDLAMHRAYRPEVVAEIAVHLGSHEDWDEIATWCGGKVVTASDQNGEYNSTLVLPNGERGSEWAWLVLDHGGEFHFRAEVAAPVIRAPRPSATQPDDTKVEDPSRATRPLLDHAVSGLVEKTLVWLARRAMRRGDRHDALHCAYALQGGACTEDCDPALVRTPTSVVRPAPTDPHHTETTP